MGIMNKRGAEYLELFWNRLIGLVLAIIIFAAAGHFINELTTSEFFVKNYLALDLGLVTDIVMSSPNDLIYLYKHPTQDYSFEVGDNTVSVYKWYVTKVFGSVANSYFIGNPSIETESYDIRPIIDVDEDEPRSVIPVSIILAKLGDRVFFYNAREEIIGQGTTSEEEIVSGEVTASLYQIPSGGEVYEISAPMDPDLLVATDPNNIEYVDTWTWGEQHPEILIAINANFFDSNNGIIGILANNGIVENFGGSFTGVFYVDESGEFHVDDLWYEDEKNAWIADMPNKNIVVAVSGQPVIVKDCALAPMAYFTYERYNNRFLYGKTGRTVVGINPKERKFYFFIFKNSPLLEAAEYVVSRGVCDALNLDGGGSTTLYIADPELQEDVGSSTSHIFSEQIREQAIANVPESSRGPRRVMVHLGIKR